MLYCAATRAHARVLDHKLARKSFVLYFLLCCAGADAEHNASAVTAILAVLSLHMDLQQFCEHLLPLFQAMLPTTKDRMRFLVFGLRSFLVGNRRVLVVSNRTKRRGTMSHTVDSTQTFAGVLRIDRRRGSVGSPRLV